LKPDYALTVSIDEALVAQILKRETVQLFWQIARRKNDVMKILHAFCRAMADPPRRPERDVLTTGQ
jgi:hypothetical protein